MALYEATPEDRRVVAYPVRDGGGDQAEQANAGAPAGLVEKAAAAQRVQAGLACQRGQAGA
ncbi:MAG: hypothetical protein Q8P41_27920 [Pseudomonadota bacterium]|nr:hypothetical protein [Pseudomonadota bacterium]